MDKNTERLCGVKVWARHWSKQKFWQSFL